MSESSVLDALRAFVHERDWEQFHTPENLAKGVSIEAAELLECFQWGGDVDSSRVKDEIADVLTYCFLLADKIGESPAGLILEKLEKTKSKYPAEKSHGRSAKYTEL
jgi:NTP pyrophosphatase (non-canonical NTP hydrolase)